MATNAANIPTTPYHSTYLEQGDDIYNNNNSINDTILVKKDGADKLIDENKDELQKDKVDVSEYLIEYDKYLNNANDGDGEGINYTELINMKGCFEDIGTCGGDSTSLLEYCTDNSTCYNNEEGHSLHIHIPVF